MAAELLSCYQVPLVVTLRAGSEQEATRASAQLGRRVVLKAEAGGLVQPMLAGGVEVPIGVVQEPVFGPLVVLGLGGAAAEVLGDHAARLAPLTDADELAHAALAAPLLSGHRDTPPVDTAALADVLLRVSQLADDLPAVAELSLSSVAASPDGVVLPALRVRVSPAVPRGSVPAPPALAENCRSSYPRAGSPAQPARIAQVLSSNACTGCAVPRRSLVPRMASGLVRRIPGSGSRWSIRTAAGRTGSGVAIWCGGWPGRSGRR